MKEQEDGNYKFNPKGKPSYGYDLKAIETIKALLTTYGMNLNTTITINCPYGHRYTVKFDDNHNCPYCEKFTQSHIKSMIAARRKKSTMSINVLDTDKNTPCGVYVVKLHRNYETFYKIGYSIHSMEERLSGCPYEIINSKTIFTSLYYAKIIERHLHILNDEYSYAPKIGFDGCSECFSYLKNEVTQIIKSLNVDQAETVSNIIKQYLV